MKSRNIVKIFKNPPPYFAVVYKNLVHDPLINNLKFTISFINLETYCADFSSALTSKTKGIFRSTERSLPVRVVLIRDLLSPGLSIVRNKQTEYRVEGRCRTVVRAVIVALICGRPLGSAF